MNHPLQKPVLIPLSVAAQIVPLGERRLRALCQEGKIPSAVQPGGERGQWFVSRPDIVKMTEPKDAK